MAVGAPFAPHLRQGRLRDQIGPVRLTPEVREALERQARVAGRTLSDYVRCVLAREAAIATRDVEVARPCR